jgi:protein-disulfide isomerase
MKNKVFVVAAISIVIALFVILKIQPDKPIQVESVTMPLSVEWTRSHSPTYGNSAAKVTVVEWFDPECESCQAFHPVFKNIIADYKGRVHFVLRYMPFHGGSAYAISALIEAQELGKFEEALDVIFVKQAEWGSHHDPRPDLIVGYLSGIGIPKEKLDREYLLRKHGEKVKMDQADGIAAGVRATPTFFVNGKVISDLGEQYLRQAIEKALE